MKTSERSVEGTKVPAEAPRDARSSGVVAVPAVPTAAVVNFVTLLREEGAWTTVRQAAMARDPFASHWIDRISEASMCPLDRACALMTATEGVVGPVRLRQLGSIRFARAMETGLLAPMLRSWARTFVGDAGTLVQLTPHLWRGSTQGLGTVEVAELSQPSGGGGAATLVFTSDHPTFVGCRAWHVYLEGWAAGLLAMRHGEEAAAARLAAGDDEVSHRVDEGRVKLSLRWSA